MSFYIIPQMRSYPASCQHKKKKSCTQTKYRPRPLFHDDDLDLTLTNFASPNLWHDMLPEFSLSMMDHSIYVISNFWIIGRSCGFFHAYG